MADQLLLWLGTCNEFVLIGGGVRDPTDGSLVHVMHCVVVDEERHAEDVHGRIRWQNQEGTNRSITTLTNVEDIVIWVHTDPLVAEHEEQVREGVITWRGDYALLETKLGFTHVVEYLLYEVLEVQGRKIDC